MSKSSRHVVDQSALGLASVPVPILTERRKTMPSKTTKQKKFMAAAAHSKEFAKKAGIPQKVAKEFHKADKKKGKKK